MDNKTVKDLMHPLSEYATVSGDATIRDAIEALDKAQLALCGNRHHHRAVLVLDDNDEVIGKLSYWAILRKLEPKFLNTDELVELSKASFTADYMEELEESLTGFLGNLTALCKKASGAKAKDAMVPVGTLIDENESLVSAIHHLVLTHEQSLLATRNGKIVGTLRLSDVFQEVADFILSHEPHD